MHHRSTDDHNLRAIPINAGQSVSLLNTGLSNSGVFFIPHTRNGVLLLGSLTDKGTEVV